MIIATQHARVFLSCGQRTEVERAIANEVAQRLGKLGFDTYIAINQQSLSTLRENIFRQLEEAEYFIFIDFKRERISIDDDKKFEYRGSLFSHQELAIASFLNLPIIAFQERGIKQLDGLMGSLQVNTLEFESGTDVPAMVIKSVQEKLKSNEWNSQWKARFTPEKPSGFFADTTSIIDNIETEVRVFHIGIHNHHNIMPVINCCVYLEKIIQLHGGQQREIESSEIKWKGVGFPNVLIVPETTRYFDAFFVFPNEPNLIHFHSLTDYSNYHITVHINMPFVAWFMVVSENFPIMHFPVTIYANDDFEKINYTLGNPVYQIRKYS